MGKKSAEGIARALRARASELKVALSRGVAAGGAAANRREVAAGRRAQPSRPPAGGDADAGKITIDSNRPRNHELRQLYGLSTNQRSTNVDNSKIRSLGAKPRSRLCASAPRATRRVAPRAATPSTLGVALPRRPREHAMLAAAPAAAVRAPTRPPALVPRGCARRGGSGRGGFGSRPVARARPRPGACVRFARTPALASRDRIAGSAVRALDPRRRSARSSSSSPAAAPIFVSAAVEVDERMPTTPPTSTSSTNPPSPSRSPSSPSSTSPRARLPGRDRGGLRRRHQPRARGWVLGRVPRGESGPRGRGGAGPLRPGPPARTRGRRQERSTHAGARVAARRRPGADAGGWRARVGDRVRPRVPRRGCRPSRA